jgi:hypothetical protein
MLALLLALLLLVLLVLLLLLLGLYLSILPVAAFAVDGSRVAQPYRVTPVDIFERFILRDIFKKAAEKDRSGLLLDSIHYVTRQDRASVCLAVTAGNVVRQLGLPFHFAEHVALALVQVQIVGDRHQQRTTACSICR